MTNGVLPAALFLACGLFIADASGSQYTGDDHVSTSSSSSHSSSSGAPWTYRRTATDGEEPYGPSDWYKEYPDCGSNAQSPINLAANTHTVVEPQNFDIEFIPHVCMSDDLIFEGNERVWEVIFEGCSEEAHLQFNGARYNLVQFHIHSPSEHATAGSLHAAEIHWVHLKEGTEDELLVVGVFFDVSEYGSNVELQAFWDFLRIGEASTDKSVETRVYDMIPPNPEFSHYMGSLTTPPCTEGVTWIVMNEPVIIGKMQLEDFRTSVAIHDDSKVDEFGNTNRPYQPLNDRDVYFVKA